MVELIDLYPTLAALSNLEDEAPTILQGDNLAPLLATPTAHGDEAAYSITRNNGATLRTAEWRYTRWGEQAEADNEELYHHRTDPREFTNLARNPAFADSLDALRARFETVRQLAQSTPSRSR